MFNLGGAALFAFVATITPGPNNVMLWASGMNYGFRRTIPHLAGVALGFASLLAATSIGLGTLFEALPWLSISVRVAGSVYLVYFAYRIATASKVSGTARARPFTFMEAASFQYLNPKAWVMVITAAGTFLPRNAPVLTSTLSLVFLFLAVGVPCIVTWAVAGNVVGRFLEDDRKRRVVNWGLALLLIFTIYLINT